MKRLLGSVGLTFHQLEHRVGNCPILIIGIGEIGYSEREYCTWRYTFDSRRVIRNLASYSMVTPRDRTMW